MSARRVIVMGNSGAGKTTLARWLCREHDLVVLDLDSIAWEAEWGVRRPLEASIAELRQHIAANPSWLVEGCYGDLIMTALPDCTDLHFLNPGVDACVAHCRARHARWLEQRRPEDQRCDSDGSDGDEPNIDELIDWVRRYEHRDDEFGLARHRAIFDAFGGDKIEYTSPPKCD